MTLHLSTLSNGLRVITDPIEGVETAALGIWVGVGARHESAETNGLAHFLEHMAFRGTVHRTGREIAESIENVGGYLNAYTSKEATAYYARVLAKDVPLALEIIADILQYSVFAEEELNRERTVILQEIGQTQDTPDDVVFEDFQLTAFPNQALGRSILGPVENVRSFQSQDFKHYMKCHYGADQMVLVATGKVDHDSIHQQAESLFNALQPMVTLNPERGVYQGGNHRRSRDLEQVHLVLGYEGVAKGSPPFYAASLLATLLGGGMSSRLFQEVREKRGLVYSIQAFTQSYRDCGVFGVYAGTSEENIAELMPVVRDECRAIMHNCSDDELRRAQNQLKASLMMARESTSARCEQLAQQMLTYGRPLDPGEIMDRIDAVSCADIGAVAQHIFSSKPTLSAIGPSRALEVLSKSSEL
ncbi:MAG: M16 family metallopeptidase [Holosporales bacterium]